MPVETFSPLLIVTDKFPGSDITNMLGVNPAAYDNSVPARVVSAERAQNSTVILVLGNPWKFVVVKVALVVPSKYSAWPTSRICPGEAWGQRRSSHANARKGTARRLDLRPISDCPASDFWAVIGERGLGNAKRATSPLLALQK